MANIFDLIPPIVYTYQPTRLYHLFAINVKIMSDPKPVNRLFLFPVTTTKKRQNNSARNKQHI